MDSPPSDRCGYTWPEDHKIGHKANRQSCCWRETASANVDRCLWHADPDEVEKSAEALQSAHESIKKIGSHPKYAELLDGANLHGVEIRDAISFRNISLRDSTLSEADLKGADLSDANLRGVNLSNADLREADLPNADLLGADLSNADLKNADLLRADLSDANLSNADLKNADFKNANLVGADLSDAVLARAILSDAFLTRATLSNANLVGADLSNAELNHTDLSNADFREANIQDVSINGSTTCKQLYEEDQSNSENWDATARAYHDLKTVFGDHGLVGKARNMHVRERRARSLEAKSADGGFSRRYLGSIPSRYFTGYGVQVSKLVIWMLLLFVISTVVYVIAGVENTFMRNVSYSVLAFTVAPPRIPDGAGTQIVVMIETFFGTLSIVLLGYILGNRERF